MCYIILLLYNEFIYTTFRITIISIILLCINIVTFECKMIIDEICSLIV